MRKIPSDLDCSGCPPNARACFAHLLPEEWELVVRDYRAGDGLRLVAERYRGCSQAILHHLKGVEGLRIRDETETAQLRTRQKAEADKVRYRLRQGLLESAAAELCLDPSLLRAVLEEVGLLLHDLPEARVTAER